MSGLTETADTGGFGVVGMGIGGGAGPATLR